MHSSLLQPTATNTIEGHHLALFTLQDLQTKSVELGSSCTTSTRSSQPSSGDIANVPELHDCLTAIAVDAVTDCHEWDDYFHLAVEAADWLPGTDAVPTGDTLKRIYLDTYPPKWVAEYEKIHGTNMAGANMGRITAFMHERAIAARAAEMRNKYKQSKSKTPPTGRRSSSKGSKYSKGSNKKPSTNGSKKLQPNDPCPIPGHDHKWGSCYNNINNPEAHKKRKERLAKNKGGDGHNHANQANESLDSDKAKLRVVSLASIRP